jgi:ribose 1,5-bisphosphate isomerase
MNKSVERVIRDIKALRIQGARNIAKAALEALTLSIKSSHARSIDQFYSEILETSDLLAATRPTEPMLRNILDNVTKYTLPALKRNAQTVKKVKELIVKHNEELLKKIEEDHKKLVECGAKLIPEGATVMTHCHSSTVVNIFKRAHEMGKEISVIACETRPLFQGRITAKELADEGIPVTLIVDGAMNLFMKKTDLCIVGADAVTSRGDLINKVGTSTLAHIARFHDISFYSAAELFKYSQYTLAGQLEKIEERDQKEVLEKPYKGITVRNPAFDATAARYISAYITEVGVIPPQSFFALATEKLGIKVYW